MRFDRSSAAAAALFLLLPATAPAWGPFTHAAIGRQVLSKIAAARDGRLSFLTREPARSVFLGASMGPDLTFSVTGFGKTDRALDKRLHDVDMTLRMVREAVEHEDAARLAFALGWYAHIQADTVMCEPGGVIYRNVFEMKPRTVKRLGGDVAQLLKIAIDSVVAKADRRVLLVKPQIDVETLARWLQETAPTGSVDSGQLDRRLDASTESFMGAVATVRELCQSFAANKRAYGGLCDDLTEKSAGEQARVPGVSRSALEVYKKLGELVPEGFDGQAAEGLRPPGRTTRGLWDRLTASLTRRGRSVMTGDGLASRATRGVLEGAMRAMNSVGLARERTRRARVMATFIGEMVSGERDWPEVKRVVREAAEDPGEASNSPDEEPAPDSVSDAAPLDGEP